MLRRVAWSCEGILRRGANRAKVGCGARLRAEARKVWRGQTASNPRQHVPRQHVPTSPSLSPSPCRVRRLRLHVGAVLSNACPLRGQPCCRVARGGCPPPAPTEPDLWISHPALRDTGVGAEALMPVPGLAPPQLSQFQPQIELYRGELSCPPLSVPCRQREQSPLFEVFVSETLLHRRSSAQVPEASSPLVDRSPGLLRWTPELDESARDRALAPPVLQQHRTESAPDVGIQIS